MRRVAHVALALVIMWGVGLLAVVVAHLWLSRADRAPVPQADAIICLGAGMASDTSIAAGPSSERRALACAALYANRRAPLVIFTGEGHEFGSAARAMADVAEAAGVPPEAIRVEPFAGSTIQNAAFSLPLLPNAAERIIIVSDGFHLPRAWVIFRALGPQEVILHATTDAPFGQIFRWIRRESVAIWFNLWRAALYWGGGVLGIDRDTRIAWFD